MALDGTPLANARARLREALMRHQAGPQDEQLRDGLIQRFEFIYELSHRTLRRYLQERSPSSDEVARMSFAELIRAGNAQGQLRPDEAAMLREAFEESDLPWRVDMVDWHSIDDRFRRAITPQMLPLLGAAAP
jgi:hypothetical protein